MNHWPSSDEVMRGVAILMLTYLGFLCLLYAWICLAERIFFGPAAARFANFRQKRSCRPKLNSVSLFAKPKVKWANRGRGRLKSGRMSGFRRRTEPPVSRRSSRPSGP